MNVLNLHLIFIEFIFNLKCWLWVVECNRAVLNMSVWCWMCLWSLDCAREVLTVPVKCWMHLWSVKCVLEVLNVSWKDWMCLGRIECVCEVLFMYEKGWMCVWSDKFTLDPHSMYIQITFNLKCWMCLWSVVCVWDSGEQTWSCLFRDCTFYFNKSMFMIGIEFLNMNNES